MHAGELFGLEADHRLFMLPFEFVLQDDTISHWTHQAVVAVLASFQHMQKLFMEGKDHSAVTLAIAELYDVSIEDVEDDVTAFAADLKEKGLL